MDKKTIIVLPVLMTLFCMQGYAQMFSDTLCWKQKDEAAIELYNYMSGIVCDNSPIVVNSGGSLFGFGEKKRIKKERALQRQCAELQQVQLLPEQSAEVYRSEWGNLLADTCRNRSSHRRLCRSFNQVT